MKRFASWVVTLGVLCICAVSANADLLIDSFNYSSDAALQAVWSGTPAPTMATISGVPSMGLNAGATGAGYGGVSVYQLGSWDLTGCTGFTMSMAATNPQAVFYPFITLYTGDKSSYYSVANYNYNCGGSGANTLSGELQSGFIPLAWGGPGGSPDWSDVTMIVVGYYTMPNSAPCTIYISNFVANGVTPVPEPGSLLAIGAGLMGMVGFVSRRRS